MNITTLLRLTGGIGVAVLMYIYLPILELLEIVFFLSLAVVWAIVVVDVVLVSFGVIADLGQGISARGSDFVTNMREKTRAAKADLADRVAEVQATEA